MTTKTGQPVNRLDNGLLPASGGTNAAESILIAKIEPKILEIEIVGVTPLLVCRWSEKAKQQIKDKQFKRAKKPREAKNPEECYQASRYVSTDGWDGIPAGGVKGCLVNACRAVDDLPMTLAKRIVFIRAQGATKDGQALVRVYGEPAMHEAMVRIDQSTADLRYRAIYRDWFIRLQIEFLANVISPEQVCNMLELAGFVEGLCEHRPGSPKSNTGDGGRFQIRRPE